MSNDGETKDNAQSGEAPTPPTPPPKPQEIPEPSDWETRFKYLLADFDNFRRRTERDRTGARTEAEATLLRRLIPLVEGFQHAEIAGQSLPSSDPLRRGLELLRHELDTVLKSVGFAPVARVGEAFRPEEHEAVGEVQDPKNVADGDVAEIVQQGYRFQGGLLRPAKVIVARASPGAESSGTPPSESGTKEPTVPTAEEDPAG